MILKNNIKKVCLVVDNPARDLDGLILTAKFLADLGVSVFLVPMYQQRYEIPSICPDLVVMNYARKANREFIQAYSKAGISVGVLDTEGGVWESSDQFVKSVDHQASLPFLSFYFFWGKRQHDAFINKTSISPYKCMITGNPRYDFYSKYWRNTLIDPLPGSDPYILVITNCTLAHPKFTTSVQNEIDNMVSAGYERKYAMERYRDDLNSRAKIVEVVLRIAKDFPDQNIVVRPHPFEDESEYTNKFCKYKNIYVIGKGTVGQWINKALIVLHINSSVAIDAFFMDTPVYTLEWCLSDITRGMSEITMGISEKAGNYNELKNIINSFKIKDEHNSKSKENDINREAADEVYAWFHHCDGQNARRVSHGIHNYLKDKSSRPFESKCKNLFLIGSRRYHKLIGIIESTIRVVLGYKTFETIKTKLYRKKKEYEIHSAKEFSGNEVREILERINNVTDDKKKYFVHRRKMSGIIERRICKGVINITKAR